MAPEVKRRLFAPALICAVLLASPAHGADGDEPTLRRLALAAFDRTRLADDALAQWRSANAALFAALEARGYAEGQAPEGNAPPTSTGGPIEG